MMNKIIKEIYKDEYGQGLVEYSLIISLVIIVVIVALQTFGLEVLSYYNFIEDKMPK